MCVCSWMGHAKNRTVLRTVCSDIQYSVVYSIALALRVNRLKQHYSTICHFLRYAFIRKLVLVSSSNSFFMVNGHLKDR